MRWNAFWAICWQKSTKVCSTSDLVKWEDRGGSSSHPGIWSELGQMRTWVLEHDLGTNWWRSQVREAGSLDKFGYWETASGRFSIPELGNLDSPPWEFRLASSPRESGLSEHGRPGVREFYYWNAADSMTSPSQLASAHFHTARFCEHVQICSFVSTEYKMRLLCSLLLNIPLKKE